MKNKFLKILVILIILIVITLLLLNSFTNILKRNPIVFKDPVFEKMIKNELDKKDIYPGDLKGYTGILIAADRLMSFSGNGKNIESITLFYDDSFEYKGAKYTEFGTIRSLEDLKHFPNLTDITINLQPEIDYNTIPNKTKIKSLNLRQSKIEDLTFLNGYSNLFYLTLSNNKISSLSGIETLTTLKKVSLASNNITDVDMLKDLTDLEELDLALNKIRNIIPLLNLKKLKVLSLYENGLSNINPLSELKSLKELNLANNNITNINPLKDFQTFESLNVSGNLIENIEVISHIENVIK